jgi:hypothetical protein
MRRSPLTRKCHEDRFTEAAVYAEPANPVCNEATLP